ncbi:9364_t:CDS:2 [Funneliformis geosporum]|uniref:9364_t:CDS:1 n=1 Tax=Funneliformis geosporum TaxID=1117311 RepID=A0A9W4WPW2_9GLOM|nr:9364_t:CDS:2 [Funneliformis geosporum]
MTYIHCSQSIAWLGNPRVTLQEAVEARPRKAVFLTRYRRPPSRRASLKAQQSWQVPLKSNSSC